MWVPTVGTKRVSMDCALSVVSEKTKQCGGLAGRPVDFISCG